MGAAPLCRRFVRRRPRLDGAPPPRAGGGGRSCSGRWAGRPVGVVINDLTASRFGWLGAWLIGHLLTGQPLHTARRPALGPARLSRRRDERCSDRRLRRSGRFGARSASATRSRPCGGEEMTRIGGRRRIRKGRGRDGERRLRRAGRGRDRRWRARRSGPRGASGRCRPRGRRPRAGAGLALAGRRRVHLARGGRGAATSRPRRGDPRTVARPIPAMRVETPPAPRSA